MNLMNLWESNLLSTEISFHLKNKKTFDELVHEKSSEFNSIEKRIDLYNYKIEGRISKDFGNYENLLELFKN